MAKVCYNKECDYWTRCPNGECDADSFCGGYMEHEGEEKDREESEAGNSVKRPHMHKRNR